MKLFLKDWGRSILTILGITVGLVFVPKIADNVHKNYLRYLSQRVVKITNAQGNSGATGFIVKGKSGTKYIMTNQHVCDLQEKGELFADYQGEHFPVKVFKGYEWSDLCVLEAHRPLGFAFSLAWGASLGETVYAIGHPLLEPTSVTSGEISGPVVVQIITRVNPVPANCSGPTYRMEATADPIAVFFGVGSICIRTMEANAGTTIILPGNSGSPVVNILGNVVGVMFAANEAGTRSYNVTLEDLKRFLSEL